LRSGYDSLKIVRLHYMPFLTSPFNYEKRTTDKMDENVFPNTKSQILPPLSDFRVFITGIHSVQTAYVI
jgi:hypothetical protein